MQSLLEITRVATCKYLVYKTPVHPQKWRKHRICNPHLLLALKSVVYRQCPLEEDTFALYFAEFIFDALTHTDLGGEGSWATAQLREHCLASTESVFHQPQPASTHEVLFHRSAIVALRCANRRTWSSRSPLAPQWYEVSLGYTRASFKEQKNSNETVNLLWKSCQ